VVDCVDGARTGRGRLIRGRGTGIIAQGGIKGEADALGGGGGEDGGLQ
jgi:hypothetical protein